MNAKKIMGAVLVALLALAVFAGAGAAATVFVYQTGASAYDGDWISEKGQVSIVGGKVTPVGAFTPGIYENESGTKLSIVYPTATISGIAGEGKAAYPFIGANLYESDSVTITNVSAAVSPIGYLLTYPNTTTIEVTQDNIKTTVENLGKGTYKLAVFFNNSSFVPGTSVDLLKTEPVSFTIVGADDATIVASVDQMNKGETFTITVTGQPGVDYIVNTTYNAFKVADNQPGITFTDGNVTFEMPNSGKVSFTIAGNTSFKGDSEQTIKLWYLNSGVVNDTKESIKVKFAKGTLTAKTEAASYFVGDVVKIVGTSTAGEPSPNYKINGTNFGYVQSAYNDWQSSPGSKYDVEGDSVKTFEFLINTANVFDATSAKKMDVGTYTITIKAGDVEATIPLTLKQPFISIVEAPEIIVQGEDEVEFIINAEAALNGIGYYIFGTNYFLAKINVADHPDDEDGEDIENQFIVELTATETEAMAPGQYFAVFQHPMYDQQYNISADSTTSWWIKVNNADTINVKERQTANAAQALCDALDAQGIDDMYVKHSFFVVGEDESFTISEIPTSVAQGETITISGVSTANADNTVTVEMISTAFAAVPKETVGSAAFIVVTTEVAEDGTWEVTLDTSDLNVDEYSLKVACGDDTWKNVKINVVEAGDEPVTPPTDEPGQDEPGQDEPVAPETPGFGALAALAGLGAVAVLLLRRE